MEKTTTAMQDLAGAFNWMRAHKRLTAAGAAGVALLAGAGFAFNAADNNVREGAVTGIHNSLTAIKAAEHSSNTLNAQGHIPFTNPVTQQAGKYLVMGDVAAPVGQRCFMVDAQQGGVFGKNQTPKIDAAGRPSYESKMLKVCMAKASP